MGCVWKILLKSKFSYRWNAFKRIELKRHFAYAGAEAWRVWKLYDLRSHNWIQRDILSHIYIFIDFLQFTADWMLIGFLGPVPRFCPFYQFCALLKFCLFVPVTSLHYILRYWSLFVQFFMKQLTRGQRSTARLISVMFLSTEDSMWNHDSALTSFISFSEVFVFCISLFVDCKMR